MNDNFTVHHGIHLFRVEVGHLSVTVKGWSVDEALREGRKQLCEEMPRLWDVIQSREETAFRVIQLT